MPLVYRVMKAGDDGKPVVGRSATALGVRIPQDITADADVNVAPGTGGMSVSPWLKALPAALVPVALKSLVPGARNSAKTARVWRMGSGPFVEAKIGEKLQLRPDSPRHGTIQPFETMPLQAYEEALAATRDHWLIAESGE